MAREIRTTRDNPCLSETPPPIPARDEASMRHTISVLVENEFGVLARVAGMFSGR